MKLIMTEDTFSRVMGALENDKEELPTDYNNSSWSLKYNAMYKKNAKLQRMLEDFNAQFIAYMEKAKAKKEGIK